MNNKKVLLVISILLIVVGVSICFAVAIFHNEDLEVRIERAGICNPLKPVEEKEVKISDDEKDKIRDYWKDTDKEKDPDGSEVVDSLVGDYKLFVGEDIILFNLDLGYVSYNGKYVDISDQFIKYLSQVVRKNDDKLEEDIEKPSDDLEKGECCSCCPDLKPGESCITACCECP